MQTGGSVISPRRNAFIAVGMSQFVIVTFSLLNLDR